MSVQRNPAASSTTLGVEAIESVIGVRRSKDGPRSGHPGASSPRARPPAHLMKGATPAGRVRLQRRHSGDESPKWAAAPTASRRLIQRCSTPGPTPGLRMPEVSTSAFWPRAMRNPLCRPPCASAGSNHCHRALDRRHIVDCAPKISADIDDQHREPRAPHTRSGYEQADCRSGRGCHHDRQPESRPSLPGIRITLACGDAGLISTAREPAMVTVSAADEGVMVREAVRPRKATKKHFIVKFATLMGTVARRIDGNRALSRRLNLT